MFDLFNGQKNPFAADPFMPMMGMNGNEESEDGGQSGFGFPFMQGMGGMNSEFMQFMQQMISMQMQMAQSMFMMPFQMMQGMANMAGMPDMSSMPGMPGLAEMFKGFMSPDRNEEDAASQQAGFSLGGMNIPPELLKKFMQMDMSPENLEKLQKVLDFVFETMPEPEDK